LAFLTAILVLSLAVSIPIYSKFKRMAGTDVTISAEGFADLLQAYRALLFYASSGIALMSGTAAWTVFKNLKRIRDDKPNVV